jgi:hypothetical protein
LLLSIGTLVLVPVLTSLLDSKSRGQVRQLSSLQLISWRSGSSSKDATAPKLTAAKGPAVDFDVGSMVAAASPFYVPPPPPPSPPVVALSEAIPSPPPAVAVPAGPPMPPPANKATRRRREKGLASWYQIYNGTCAHKTLPKGTLVRVVNLANKKELVCRVADRGPYLEGRIIDLDLEGFKQLADRSEGVIDVHINW